MGSLWDLTNLATDLPLNPCLLLIHIYARGDERSGDSSPVCSVNGKEDVNYLLISHVSQLSGLNLQPALMKQLPVLIQYSQGLAWYKDPRIEHMIP